MLTNDRDRRICEEYSAYDETGHVHCHECPLVVDRHDMMCKGNSHYDRREREWVLDEAEGEE